MSQGGEVKPRAYRRHRFAKRYTRADIEVLAAVDEAHETLSGPATQKILQRAWHEFQDGQCERLARLSVAQLYRLRKSGTHRHRRVAYQPTRPTQVAIGDGANPIRNGDRDICAWTPCIKVTCMGADLGSLAEPVLEAMLAQFPFHIRGFHSDNASEFINHTVAEMLIQTAGRANQVVAAPRQRAGGIEKRLGDPQAHRLRPHRLDACGGFRRVLSAALQSVSELSPAVRSARGDRDG